MGHSSEREVLPSLEHPTSWSGICDSSGLIIKWVSHLIIAILISAPKCPRGWGIMEQGGEVPWFEIPQKRSMCVSAAASLWVWDGQRCWNSRPLQMDQSLGRAGMPEFLACGWIRVWDGQGCRNSWPVDGLAKQVWPQQHRGLERKPKFKC